MPATKENESQQKTTEEDKTDENKEGSDWDYDTYGHGAQLSLSLLITCFFVIIKRIKNQGSM